MTPREHASDGLPADQISIDKIEEIVGAVNIAQQGPIVAALETDPVGTLALARRVASRRNVRNPVAVFLKAIENGEHRPRRDPKAKSERLPTLETALRLFAAKLVDLERHTSDDPDWTQQRRVEFAIDYAIGEAPRMSIALPAGQSILDVEAELRRRVNATGRITRVETPEQAFERRREIGRQWQRIQGCMHDPRIAAMFRALTDQCEDPDNPTDDEGESTRQALIAEIEHLDVKPRGAGPLLPATATPGVLTPADLNPQRSAELAAIDAEDLPW